MSTRRVAWSAAVTAIALALAACGGDGPPARGDVVAALGDTVAVPAFTAFDARAGALVTATAGLCAKPGTATLARARESLVATRGAWRATEAVELGPVMQQRSWARVDYPIDVAGIEALLADTSRGPLDAAYIGRKVAAGERGLGAIEWLLYAPDLEALDAASDPRRCQYLIAVAEVVRTEAALLLAAWTTDTGAGASYRDVMAGLTSTMTPTESIDELINDMLVRLGDTVQRELGVALGLTVAEADPSVIVEGGGGFGVSDQRSRAAGMRAVLLGPDGRSGLSPLLDDALVARLAAEFDAITVALDAVDGPLVAAITAEPGKVTAVHEAFAALRVTVATEVVSQLGVTVGFSDADGDGAG